MLSQLSRFAMDLNNDAPDLLQCVAPSDSRLRPDLRLLEQGDWEAAQREKLRLEEKHRVMQAKRDRSRTSHRPRWFRKVSAAQGKRGSKTSPSAGREDEVWEYSGAYWETRQAGHGFAQAAT